MPSTTRATESRSRSGVHYVLIHAHDTRTTRGAYVSCWVDFRLDDGALMLARYYIRDAGWKVRSVQERYWINSLSDVPRPSRRYFREAKADGISCVFHCYDRRARPSGRR